MSSHPDILTATVTPFDGAGALDLGAFRALLQHVTGKSDGVFVGGTTGEFPALSDDERTALVTAALQEFPADRVVAHVGAPSLRQAEQSLRAAAGAGAYRFAALTPYYLKASAAGVRDYFAGLRAAADAAVDASQGRPAELYVYVFPDVAGTDVSVKELADLAALGADGVKISGTASGRVQEYAPLIGPAFRLWSGNDAALPLVTALGGTGTVSGCSGVAPSAWRALSDALAAGSAGDGAATGADALGANPASSGPEQAVVQQLVDALGPSISRLKYGLDLLGLPGGATRMPIDPPAPAVQQQIRDALIAAELL